MPIYLYECETCGETRDEFRKVDDRDNAPDCHGAMVRRITPVRGSVQETCHYVCPETGQGVTSWAQRRNIMAEHRLVDARDINTKKMRDERKANRAAKKEAAEKAGVHGAVEIPA